MRKNSRRNNRLRGLRSIACCLAAVICIGAAGLTADAASGTVIAESAKIRSTAGTSGEPLGSVKKDEKVDIIGQVDGSDGKAWYQVYVNGDTKGYIRSDLLKVEEEVQALTASAADGDAGNSTETAATVTESAAKAGKITSASVNVRKGPAKTDAVVGSLKQNNEVTITGETNDGEGALWYQVSAEANGKTVTGFVLGDLIEVTETGEAGTEVPEETPEGEEGSEPAEEEGGSKVARAISSRILPKDVDISSIPIDESTLASWEEGRYYLLYMIDDDGTSYYYLYDMDNHIYQRMESLSGGDAPEPAESDGGFGMTAKIVVGILAVVVVILIVIIVILALKLRGNGYGDEDEEDEDEEEDEEDGRVNSRAWRPRNFLRSPAEDDDEEDDEEEDEDEDEEEDYEPPKRPVRRAPVRQDAPRRKPEGEMRQAPRQRPQEPPRRRPEGQEEVRQAAPPRQRPQEPPRRRPEGAGRQDAPVRRRPEGNEQGAPVRRRPEGEVRQAPKQRPQEQPRRQPEGADGQEAPVRRSQGAPVRRKPEEEAPVRRRPEEAPEERSPRKAPPRKSLYDEDDEFEFEFLNMDGKEDL